MFEHKHRPLLSRVQFLKRQMRRLLVSGGVMAAALGVGVVGYHRFEGKGWIDSVYTASNILTGMGPAADLRTDAGKLFGSAYAMFSGVVFLTAAPVLLAPAAHRLHFEFEGAMSGAARAVPRREP